MATEANGRAIAMAFSQDFSRINSAPHIIGPCRLNRALGFDNIAGDFVGFEFALRAFDGAAIGQRGKIVNGQR